MLNLCSHCALRDNLFELQKQGMQVANYWPGEMAWFIGDVLRTPIPAGKAENVWLRFSDGVEQTFPLLSMSVADYGKTWVIVAPKVPPAAENQQ